MIWKSGVIDAALALARAQVRELVTWDQVAVKRVVEELTDGGPHVGVLWSYPRQRFVAAEAVERSIVKLADERPQAVAHVAHGRAAPSRRLLRPLAVRPSHRDLTVIVNRCARKLAHCRDAAPTVGVIDFLAQFGPAPFLGVLERLQAVMCADPLLAPLVLDISAPLWLAAGASVERHQEASRLGSP